MGQGQLRENRLVYVLAAVAVAQITILALATDGGVAAAPVLEPGFELGSVQTTTSDQERRRLAEDRATLVLVFHSECGHCRLVAPTWAEWLRRAGEDLPIVAVSREPIDDARAYADEHGWDVEVRSVEEPPVGTTAFELIRRTPWVLALDEEGRVIVGGHGSEIESVAQALRDHVGSS